MFVKILFDTWLKQSDAPAAKLEPKFKSYIKQGTYEIAGWDQGVSGHFKVAFTKPVTAIDNISQYQSWLVYGEHVSFLDGQKNPDFSRDCQLNVSYCSQRKSGTSQWWRMCCSASNWMLARALNPKIMGEIPTQDSYLQRLNATQGDTTDHDAHTRFLRQLGIESAWRKDLDIAFIDRALKAKIPVVISLYHKGSLSIPSGGHCLIVIGRKGDDLICNDPWGEGFAENYDLNQNGQGVSYPIYPSIERRWLTDGDKTGWGRIVYSVDGKPTGLK